MDEDKQNISIMDLCFYILVEIALGGIGFWIAKHRMSYGNLQWVAGVGVLFLGFFVLTKILSFVFTNMKKFGSYIKKAFGKESPEDTKIKQLEILLKQKKTELDMATTTAMSLESEKVELESEMTTSKLNLQKAKKEYEDEITKLKNELISLKKESISTESLEDELDGL